MKVPLVLLSGGMDSTYLVSYMLAEDGPIDILYVNGGQAQEKMKLELEARDRLIEFMNREYPNKIQRQYEILQPVYLHDGQSKKWNQPNSWMQGAYRVLDAKRHSCVRVAYVDSDGAYFGKHLQHVEDQWNSMLKHGFHGDPIPLEFPLLHMTKLNVLEEIDKRLLPMVWVCEMPSEGKACQKCSPCMLANLTLYQYKQKHEETVWRAVARAQRKGPYCTDRAEQRVMQHVGKCSYVDIRYPSYDYYKCPPEYKLETIDSEG
jgi:7-cyano-7-deazaguanine synthase in queuosine biosynthesis